MSFDFFQKRQCVSQPRTSHVVRHIIKRLTFGASSLFMRRPSTFWLLAPDGTLASRIHIIQLTLSKDKPCDFETSIDTVPNSPAIYLSLLRSTRKSQVIATSILFCVDTEPISKFRLQPMEKDLPFLDILGSQEVRCSRVRGKLDW